MRAGPKRGSLVRNPSFRRLWGGNAISLFGDWFTYVAVGVLALEQGEGLMAVAVVLVGHSLPRALFGPWAGQLIDRYDRRTIMVTASLLRALTVVFMILAAREGALGVVQALVFVRIALSAFIDPAGLAMLPQLVEREQIARANALLSATWSVMFAVGVAAGGLVTAWAGPVASLAVDALTFVISAGVFATLPRCLPAATADVGRGARSPKIRGLSLAWAEPEILRAALGKLPVSIANGGAWILLHQVGGAGLLGPTALGLGILHAARAVGTGVGPLIFVGPLRASVLGMRVSVGLSLVAVVGFALVESPVLLVSAAFVWGVGAGANWVASSTRMQLLSKTEELGRIASLDSVSFSLAQSVGGLLGAVVADALAEPELAAWAGAAGGLLGWLGVGLLVRVAGARGGGDGGDEGVTMAP